MKRLSLISYKSKTREQVYHNSSWLQTDRLPEFAVHWTLESSQDLRGVSSFSSRADGTKKNGFQSTSWIGVQFGIIANSTSILNGAEVVVEELGGVARLEPVGHGPHVGEQRSAGRLKVPSALGGRT